ncbi:MAG: redox-regulated ATPase YchF [Chloroflexi bacterium]|nr:redox-regulated ATPase YchF [Chloroflexota bacterium]
MRLGIIGLPLSGKTTIFNALTRGDQPTSKSGGGGRFQVHTAVVPVPDPRVDRLSEMYRPRKTIYAQVTYADISGLESESAKGGFSGPLLNTLTQMDGFLLALRAFADESVPHPLVSLDPARDLKVMAGELLLNDLIAMERKLERLGDEGRKGGQRDKALAAREQALFLKLQEELQADRPLRELDLPPEEHKMLSGYGLLTDKPLLAVLNAGEGQGDLSDRVPPAGRRAAVVTLQGQLEMELAQLPPEEAGPFLAEYGIAEPGLNRMIRLSYDLLGLQSFFTVGEDEVRAWTVGRGATAPEAAGEIHTDLQRGFIRAETFSYEDLVAAGSVVELKARGKFRLEGKEYAVQDGDILNIRFSPRA